MSREHEVLLVSTGPRQLADWLSRRACAVIDVARRRWWSGGNGGGDGGGGGGGGGGGR